MKVISLIGATGSIGRQTLEVIAEHPDRLRLGALAVQSRWEEACAVARRFGAEAVAIASPDGAQDAVRALQGTGISVLAGDEGIRQIAAWPGTNMTLVAASGVGGLVPTCAALAAGRDVALANKESLVSGGALVTALARQHGAQIVPVDSEHSAIFQCLLGGQVRHVRRLWLTASGGPFRGWTAEAISAATAEQALRHPVWHMGPRVTVDSASLFNKGLEVIEAGWLFGIGLDAIGVTVHPQSIVHSLVEMVDGSCMAQCAVPDMRLPIRYALSHPERWSTTEVPRLDLCRAGRLDFEEPDLERFPCLRLAYEAAAMGGTAPAVLNAADEIAVQRFLRGDLRFGAIPRLIAAVLEHLTPNRGVADLEEVLAVDAEARRRAQLWSAPLTAKGVGR